MFCATARKTPFLLIVFVLVSGRTVAQVVPDDTLPTNSSVHQGDRTVITGGTEKNDNLFHSFEEFSLPTGTTAWFNNGADIKNIITRVTGKNLSEIDGLISANGSANLFFINPNGIVFGPNAQLNIGGSFIGTTAESMLFQDDTVFSATEIDTSPLLTITAPIGLQTGGRSAAITVRGTGNNLSFTPFLSVDRSARTPGLEVLTGRTLALVGGDISLEGGNLTAAEGRIELDSVSPNQTVNLQPTDTGWTLSYEGLGQAIRLTEASLDTSGRGGGDIDVQGRRIIFSDGSTALASTFGDRSGGILTVRAEEIELVGETADGQFRSGLFADVLPGGTGNGGSIDIRSDRLSLQAGAIIGAGTFSSGDAGNLTVEATEIEVAGVTADGRFPSGITAGVLPGATGRGGALSIKTERLYAADGAQIGTSTLGIGDAGDLTIEASVIELVGAFPNGTFFSNISTNALPGATGSGGQLAIETDSLLIADGGGISVSNAGFGSAGDMSVSADTVTLTGTSPQGQPSSISAISTSDFAAGSVQIDTERLLVQDGAEISASSLGAGEGGNLTITADTLSLNRGRLSAEVRAGTQGNISVQADNILLRRGSNITTNATGTATGGNITIDTNFLVALNNSDLTANAETSFGGQIDIAAQGVLGAEFREQVTPESDITASSQLGVQFSGQVDIKTPENRSDYGVVKLPETVIDSARLISNSCTPTDNTFVITGRGGLPENPTQPLRGQSIWLDWRLNLANPADRSLAKLPRQELAALTEAQGWTTNKLGNVELFAPAVAKTELQTASCQT